MITVINRSLGGVGYTLPEMNIRRTFTPGEKKQLEVNELTALYQSPGGAELLRDYLVVLDKEWTEEFLNPPLEYYWGEEEIKACLLEDELELFSETLDYAPEGVLEIMKDMAWRLPLADLNKVEAIKEKLSFDVMAAIVIMKDSNTAEEKPVRKERLRRG